MVLIRYAGPALGMILAACMAQPGSFSSMSPMPTGEYFAYGYYKADLGAIEDLVAETDKRKYAFASASLGSETRIVAYPGAIDVGPYAAQRVPDWIEIRWRKHAVPGAPPYTGEPVGPFRVEVRKWISREVLDQVRGSTNLQLRLIFSIHNNGVKFRWDLHDYGGQGPGTKILRSGSAPPHALGAQSSANDTAAVDSAALKVRRTDEATRTLLTVVEEEGTAGDIASIRRALASGADIEGRSVWERTQMPNAPRLFTPLMLAAGNGTPDVVSLLLQQGAKVNSVNVEGSTALFYAILAGKTQNAKRLLQYGANPSLRRKDGQTPLSLARQHGNAEIVSFLHNAGAKE